MTDAAAIQPRRDLIAWVVLFSIGICWGLTGPLSKVAVSTGHHPVAVTFWSVLVSVVVFSIVLVVRRIVPPFDLRHVIFFFICGFLGTAMPNTLSYEAYRHLPVGINVMILSLVPMATLLLSVALRLERVDARRAFGLGLGVIGVALITLPEASLPSPELAVFVALPVIVSLSYAAENVYIAKMKPDGATTLIVMWGLSVGGFLLIAPLAFGLGVVFDVTAMGPPEQAVLASGALHLIAYFGFVWLIARAGPVFASQVGYIVTGTGVLLGMALFDERHSVWVWAALAVMMIGLTLVRPKSDP
ncbi:MAG: DMT family transporter [Pseudomonadota bacterium]